MTGYMNQTIIDKLHKFFVVAAILMLTSFVYAEFKVASAGDDYVEVEFTLPEYQLAPVIVNDHKYYRFEDPTGGFLMVKGLPEILTYSTIIAIPDRGDYNVGEPQIVETRKFNDIKIFPSQGFDFEISQAEGFQYNSGFYKKDTFYPNYAAQVSSPSIMRSMRLVNLTVYPFSFNPAKRELDVHHKLIVRIDFDKTVPGVNELPITPLKFSRPFEKVLSENVINYHQFRGDDLNYQQRSL